MGIQEYQVYGSVPVTCNAEVSVFVVVGFYSVQLKPFDIDFLGPIFQIFAYGFMPILT